MKRKRTEKNIRVSEETYQYLKKLCKKYEVKLKDASKAIDMYYDY